MKYCTEYLAAIMAKLTEYFETVKVPKTINAALKDLGISPTNGSRTVKLLREEFPDEMKALEQTHYCIPSSSRGSIISGYFFVKYKDEIISYINEGLSMDKIYDILMEDPRNKHLEITKKKFMIDIYNSIKAGSCPEIKKAYNERAARRLGRLEEIYKDVMASEPNTYNVQSLSEKYKISKPMLYLLIKHTACGNKLMELLDYTEYTNCDSRSYNFRLIEDMKRDGFDIKEISDLLGISEKYTKYGLRSIESIDERLLKIDV